MTVPKTAPWKGLDTTRMPDFIDYDQAERLIAALRERISAWNPEAVIAIVRGGLVPGTMAACMLALPLAMVGFDRTTGSVFWIGPPVSAKRILLVDDSCSTGTTLRSTRDWLAAGGYECSTLTIVHDPEVTGFVPDFSHARTKLFRLPWERGEATPAARAGRKDNKKELAAEAPFIGLDLDGIFCADIEQAHYDRDLTAAIEMRHRLEPHAVLPVFNPQQAVVITARPERDRAITESWLKRWGHAGLALECRPESIANNRDAIARYKAEVATRLGCTHFIESEPELAIRIAAEAPHLIVSWWSADEARGWIVGAAGS